MSENKIFPRAVKVIPADNGYLVKVGCCLFVIEGNSKNITEDLKRYLDCDETIIKKFGHKEPNAFLRGNDDEEELCEKKCINEVRSPAFDYIRKSGNLISCIYKAENGKIEVNMENKTVLVYQKSFDDPKEVDI